MAIRIILVLCLFVSTTFAAGPIKRHEDPTIQEEFRNVYKDIQARGGVLTTGTTAYRLTAQGNGLSPIWEATSGFGVVQSSQCTSVTAFSTTNTAFQSTTLTCKITPSSSSSKVKASITGTIRNGTASENVLWTLFRGSTNVGHSTNGFGRQSIDNESSTPVAFIYLDSPASTSELTYTVKIRIDSGGSAFWGIAAPAKSIMLLEEMVGI